VLLSLTGTLRLNPVALAQGTTTIIVVLAVCYFAYLFLFGGHFLGDVLARIGLSQAVGVRPVPAQRRRRCEKV